MRPSLKLPSSVSSALFIVLLLSPAAHAGIYKWVDEDGQVHYGERPAGTQAERLNIKTRKPAPKAAETDEQPAAEQQAQPQQEKALPGELVEQPVPRAERRRRCADARERVSSIQSRARLKITDEKGNVRALTPKERDERLRYYRARIREYCR